MAIANVGSRSPANAALTRHDATHVSYDATRVASQRVMPGHQNPDTFPLIKHQSGGVTRTQLVVRRIASFSSTEGRGITLGFWLGGVGT